MKFNFDIDCTPEEARRFLGLPDVLPMQEKMMETLEERMAENIRSLDPETLMKTWFPSGFQGMQDMQKMFWQQMGIGMPPSSEEAPASKSKKKA
ncbi:MAG: hypothetical protein H6853_02215 [Rhodospirillales bacterium]|nr:hypothetical protein [Alphaproteobacteria bacterium]USO04112.1 MAG: hypothetical protein H6853_02215 [Rhodospirillales bacterium]